MRPLGRVVAAAVFAGGLQALALHARAGWALALVALVPLLVALESAPARHAVAAGIAYAIAAFELDVAPWLAPAIARYLGVEPARAIALAVAVAAVAGAAHGALLGGALALRPRAPRAWQVVWLAAAWAVWESLRLPLPPFFPAATIGAAETGAPALLQLASATGIAGVTAVVVAANAGIASLWARGASRFERAAALATGAGLVVAASVWGAARLASPPGTASSGPTVIAVDGAARSFAESTLARYLAATPSPRERGAAIVLWPESAITVDLERDRDAWRQLARFLEEGGAVLVAGGTLQSVAAAGKLDRFNAVHVLRAGYGMDSYRKRRLVPIAESWPAALGAPPAALEPVRAGREARVFEAGGTALAPLVCFEIVDPAAATDLARRGARVLVNPTNDAWFPGDPPHLAWAQIRAVETGVPVLRVANAGPSALFDGFGRALAESRSDGRPSVLEATIPGTTDTFYARNDRAFLVACLAVVAAGMAIEVRSLRGGRRTPSRTRPS
ncbi:MAG TPA: apolipoprotein N-acyltransferase [Candidatus Binatia bacterium]|nr:apolipoprotein N-acyltransferase [Candidatus Binatia bacterium]